MEEYKKIKPRYELVPYDIIDHAMKKKNVEDAFDESNFYDERGIGFQPFFYGIFKYMRQELHKLSKQVLREGWGWILKPEMIAIGLVWILSNNSNIHYGSEDKESDQWEDSSDISMEVLEDLARYYASDLGKNEPEYWRLGFPTMVYLNNALGHLHEIYRYMNREVPMKVDHVSGLVMCLLGIYYNQNMNSDEKPSAKTISSVYPDKTKKMIEMLAC